MSRARLHFKGEHVKQVPQENSVKSQSIKTLKVPSFQEPYNREKEQVPFLHSIA